MIRAIEFRSLDHRTRTVLKMLAYHMFLASWLRYGQNKWRIPCYSMPIFCQCPTLSSFQKKVSSFSEVSLGSYSLVQCTQMPVNAIPKASSDQFPYCTIYAIFLLRALSYHI